MENSQSKRRQILQKFAGTGAMPYLPYGPEYTPMKGRFGKRLKEVERRDSLKLNRSISLDVSMF